MAQGVVALPLDLLLFLRNVPAGMDWSVVGHWAMLLRNDPCDPPIVVYPDDGGRFYRVIDGRHRCIAAYMAGRTEIEAVILDGGTIKQGVAVIKGV